MHPTYKLESGQVVPSVTQIIGLINKPQLVQWAYNLALKGENYREVSKEAAHIGTVVHDNIAGLLCKALGEPDRIVPPGIEEEDEEARNSYNAFLKWYEDAETGKKIPLLSESSLVHEQEGYGGTLDAVFNIDGDRYLVDFKTSKAIYDEYWIQLAAYAELLRQSGILVYRVAVLRLDKYGDGYDFEFHDISDWKIRKGWGVFKHLKDAYVALGDFREAME